jgi:signal transduction histidine kinase
MISLRVRFALLAAGLVLVVATLVALGGYVAMRHALLGRAEREARNQARQLAAMVESSPEQGAAANANLVNIHDPALVQQSLAPGYIVAVNGPNGALIRRSTTRNPHSRVTFPAGFVRACLTSGAAKMRLTAPPLSLACKRIGTRDHAVGALSVGAPLADALDSLATLRHALVLGVLAGALLAGALSLLLARRATRPIAQIARTAEAIRSGARPLQRIDYRGRDELGALAAVLDASFAELDDALERQRRFAADASHELRTPLAAIRPNVELLRGWAATQPAARETALASLDQASRRAARLVEDLLYLATLEHEPVRARAPVRLDEVVLGVVREAAGLRAEVPVRITKLDEATADGDSLALQQLLLNLLDNALSASPAGGEIRIALSAGEDRATITVTDRGPGIEPSELPRIFDRFYSNKSRPHRGGGAGLGLAIARAIASEHDAALVARNEPSGGATFVLTLPLALKGGQAEPDHPTSSSSTLAPVNPKPPAGHRDDLRTSA